MTEDFEGRTALVTGGGSAVGRATGLSFAKQRAKVVIADVDEESGEATVAMIREMGGEALFVRTDASAPYEVCNLMTKTVERFGRLDFAHNNASIGPGTVGAGKLTADYEEEEWDRAIAVNVKAIWLSMKYELREMALNRPGTIVNTASHLGVSGAPGLSIYSATHHAVVGLTQAAARQYAGTGIRINAVCPGGAWSSIVIPGLDLNPDAESAASAHIADTVLWLCAKASALITGQAIILDGGLPAHGEEFGHSLGNAGKEPSAQRRWGQA